MAVKLKQLKKRQRRLKRSLQPGDVFRLRLEDGRWFLGRIILTDMPAAPRGTNENLVLIYLFRTTYHGGSLLPAHLPWSDLLCAPLLVARGMWEDGYFEHLETRALTEGERLPRHCFRYLRDDVYYNETGEQIDRCSGPIAEYGLTMDAGVELAIAEALGEPVWYQHLMERRAGDIPPLPLSTVVPVPEDSVVLFIPVQEDTEPRGLDEIEDPLTEAVEGKGVGECVGHGFDADLREWDIRFVGRSPRKIVDALLPVMKELELPPGCYLVVGGKQPKRIDL